MGSNVDLNSGVTTFTKAANFRFSKIGSNNEDQDEETSNQEKEDKIMAN